MTDPRVPLKNPLLAAVLALVIPGAGHWYQERKFKSVIFFCGILTLHFWGTFLGHGQPVYSHVVVRSTPDSPQYEDSEPRSSFSWGYAAQAFTGLPAWPALIQRGRFKKTDDTVGFLDHAIDEQFVGVLKLDEGLESSRRAVTGHLQVRPAAEEGSRNVSGTLTLDESSIDPENPIREIQLEGPFRQGRKVFGSPWRRIACSIQAADGAESFGEIEGSVPRSFLNWFQAPRDNEELDRMSGSLARQFDVASVCTWIAGLLNLLAIWDAAQGPAYGYGDEQPPTRTDEEEKEEEEPNEKT